MKAKYNSKMYEIRDWETNNYQTDNSQYLK